MMNADQRRWGVDVLMDLARLFLDGRAVLAHVRQTGALPEWVPDVSQLTATEDLRDVPRRCAAWAEATARAVLIGAVQSLDVTRTASSSAPHGAVAVAVAYPGAPPPEGVTAEELRDAEDAARRLGAYRENRFGHLDNEAVPWRDRAREEPLAQSLVGLGATDAEAADLFAAAYARVQRDLARLLLTHPQPFRHAVAGVPASRGATDPGPRPPGEVDPTRVAWRRLLGCATDGSGAKP